MNMVQKKTAAHYRDELLRLAKYVQNLARDDELNPYFRLGAIAEATGKVQLDLQNELPRDFVKD